MNFDPLHPLNEQAVRHVKSARQRSSVPIAAPDDHPDPYMEAGSHPDIVERVWDQLGRSLPSDCRAMLYGGPALVEPRSGVIIALAYGTQYAIRIPRECEPAAVDAGCTVEQSWTGGGKTDIREALGDDWVFGCYAAAESKWLAETYVAVTSAKRC